MTWAVIVDSNTNSGLSRQPADAHSVVIARHEHGLKYLDARDIVRWQMKIGRKTEG